MSCTKWEEALIAYTDGRASAAERAAVEAHLRDCAACRTRAEEFARVWKTLDEAPAIEVSPAFDARLRARLAEERKPSWWAWLAPQPRLVLAMGLLLAVAVWVGTRPGPAPVDVASTVPENTNVEEEFQMIRDLPVLEDYEMLANFEALSEVPQAKQTRKREL
jgi:anti-sigma factor RsiW